MSTGHKGLLFNIGSSGKTFPGTVKYEHNSEESEGMTGKKKNSSNRIRAKAPRWKHA